MNITIMQGDEYAIAFKLKTSGNPMDIRDVESVEFVVGKLTKSYPEKVEYDCDLQRFLFPITQEETFQMTGEQAVQMRIKYKNGDILGKKLLPIQVLASVSKEVL